MKLIRGGRSRQILIASSIVTLSLASSLAAVTAPANPDGRLASALMLDARVNAKDSYTRATAARPGKAAAGLAEARNREAGMAKAVTDLRVTMPGLDVQFSNDTTGPASVRNKGGALTAAAPGRGNEQIVRDFLLQQGRIYGLSAADVDDLVVVGDSPGGTSGLRMLRIEQQIDGRQVFQSETRFLIDRDGRLMKSVGLMVPAARAVAPNLTGAALMDPAEAVTRVLASAGKTAAAAAFSVTGTKGPWLELAENDDFVAGPVSARQVLFPIAPGMLVPAWSLTIFTTGEQDWIAVVDAETGEVLWRKGIRDYISAHDARFRVYVQADGTTPADSPAPGSPNTLTLPTSFQFTEIAPTNVSMHTAMSATASPNGWINDCPGGVCTANETQTLGNNVLACLDRAGTANVCDTDVNSVLDGNGRPTGNTDTNGRDRDFLGTAPRDFQTGFLPPPQGGNPEAGQSATNAAAATSPAENSFRRGAVTSLFYVANWYHDQLYNLGFDEGSANFQLINIGGGPGAGDRVLADAQDGSGTNNANFSTPQDGLSGRAQMFRFTGPTIDRDGDLDNEILIHELTHGTSNRLVGNALGLNWDPARGMGEGWSDFYGMALLNNTNADNPDGQYASGAYGTFKFAGIAFTSNYIYGIRRFPYSTDNSINPMTWADVDDVTNNLGGGITPDPLGFNLGGAMEVHNSGELWALSLWEMRSRIIADPAGANGNVPAGNLTALQLVTDGLKMTPLNPTFVEARDAVLDADCATNACANEDSIWGGFADRGLGYGAETPYKVIGRYVRTHESVGESFSVPYLDVVNPGADVAIDDSASNNNGAIDSGEAVRLTVTLTNPWRRATKAVTGGTATLSTSTPGVTIFDNSAAFGAIAPLGSAAAGDSFLITLDTTVLCGSAIDFTLTTTSNLGTTSTTFRLRVGDANGTDPAVTYTGDPNPDLTISDNRSRGVFHQINVTDDFEIADLDFRVDAVTHAAVGDLSVMLRSPGGIGADFFSLIDGLNDCAGTSIVNMVVDDDVPAIPANDMVQSTVANSPFSKSWLPVFNSPWAALVDPLRPADPSPHLARFDGRSTLGTWSALIADNFSAAAGGCPAGTGTFGGWSMIVTPVHFDCTAFAPAANVTATKTVSAGPYTVGGTVTYTVILTNNGTDEQKDNPGDEFTDTVPPCLDPASIVTSATSGSVSANGVNPVTWNGSLAPLGGSVTITITATIAVGTQGQSCSNQGTVSYDDDNDDVNEATRTTDDPGAGGVTDPTVFVVGGATVALSGTKTASGAPYTPGGTVTYTVVLTNSGTVAQPDNPGDEFTDPLPACFTNVNSTASIGTVSATGSPVTWNGSIPGNGGTVTLTITATIGNCPCGSQQTNVGTFSYDANADGTNDTTGTTDDPAVGGANDPTIITIECAPGPEPIPTVSEWGLLALGLCLLLAAWMQLRRRRMTTA